MECGHPRQQLNHGAECLLLEVFDVKTVGTGVKQDQSKLWASFKVILPTTGPCGDLWEAHAVESFPAPLFVEQISVYLLPDAKINIPLRYQFLIPEGVVRFAVCPFVRFYSSVTREAEIESRYRDPCLWPPCLEISVASRPRSRAVVFKISQVSVCFILP